MTRAVGIDLGTTFSAIAALDAKGSPEVLVNKDSGRTMPSVVFFDDDQVVVGTTAREFAAAAGGEVVELVKRQMGNPHWRHITEDGREYTAEEISALILRRLAADASIVLGEPVMDAVITVPAYFDDARRTATRQAGEIAGLNVLGIVNEPTAAAVAFGLDSGFEGIILVYDLGGGTFDVTVLRCHGGEFTTLATSGNRNLGGCDVENEIIRWVREEFAAQTGVPLPEADADRLRESVTRAKIGLSSTESVSIPVRAAGQKAKLTLTRTVFDSLIEPLLLAAESLVEDAIDTAGLTSGQIDKVILVGGSTRIPAVAASVERLIGRTPDQSVNPDEVVARGAAVLAGLLARPGPAAGPTPGPAAPAIAVTDVVSHGLGVTVRESSARVNSVMIPANTPLPAQATELFGTIDDDQTTLRVEINEGDETELSLVTRLGESTLTIAPHPAGAPVIVTLACDVDGIVHVRVIDGTTDEDLGEFALDREANLNQTDVDRMRAALTSLDLG